MPSRPSIDATGDWRNRARTCFHFTPRFVGNVMTPHSPEERRRIARARPSRLALLGRLATLLLAAACFDDPIAPNDGAMWAITDVSLERPPVAGEWLLITVNHGANTASDYFAVSDTSLAMVDQDGRFFARAAGTVTLSVLRNGVGLDIPLTIAPAPADAFPVRFEFIGWTPSRPERAAFERAAMRLQTALREVDSPVNVDLSSSDCIAPHGTYSNLTGVVVQVGLHDHDMYDDEALADVGPSDACTVDPATGRSKVISMYLSRGRLAGYASDRRWQLYRTLENIILHEVGHGLRLVGLERSTPAPIDRSNEFLPLFTGTHAVEAWVALLGDDAGVPLTGDERHWDTLLGLDFMVHSAYAYRTISSLSLGALADYGYGAMLDRAEPHVPLLHDWVQDQ